MLRKSARELIKPPKILILELDVHPLYLLGKDTPISPTHASF
jgi:hypothetical protein